MLFRWGGGTLECIVNKSQSSLAISEAMATFGLAKSHCAPLYERPHQKGYSQSLNEGRDYLAKLI